MLHMLAVPLLGDLLHIARRRRDVPGDSDLAALWSQPGDLAYWFARSAWSLQVITTWRRTVGDTQNIVFWVPDYFCNQSLAGVRAAGATLVFYPVTDRLEPDWSRCEQLAREHRPDVFMLVHYFGRPADAVAAQVFCRRHTAIFIEDCAHALLPVDGIGQKGDFVLFSLHKLLPLPDGALLLARPKAMHIVGRNPDQLNDELVRVIASLPPGMCRVWPWLLKRLLIKCSPNWFGWFRRRNITESGTVSARPGPMGSSGMTGFTRRLLARQQTMIEAFGWSRVERAELLKAAIRQTLGEVTFVPGPEARFPYMIGVMLRDVERAGELKRKARQVYCPFTTWPDLAPEVLAQPEEHATAIALARRTVFFPVHHTLNIRVMLRRLTGGMATGKIATLEGARLRWDLPTPDWDELYRKAPRSSLLQARAYAVAKERAEGWIPRLGVAITEQDPVATVIVLERRGPFGVALGRLNRGPMWLAEQPEPALALSAMKALAQHYGLSHGRLLSAAPNLEMRSEHLCGLHALGFRRRVRRPWTSSWLDLRVELGHLHRTLDGRWRNQLHVAEKKELRTEVSEGEATFEWLLGRYVELAQSRGFAGPSPKLLRHLRQACMEQGEAFWVLQAVLHGEPVSGIAVVRHGTSATYLIGWNGPEGRRAYANNLLLWRAVQVLQAAGVQWFDVGGFDEWRTPGIAAFKRGLNGAEYRLVGEYIHLGHI